MFSPAADHVYPTDVILSHGCDPSRPVCEKYPLVAMSWLWPRAERTNRSLIERAGTAGCAEVPHVLATERASLTRPTTSTSTAVAPRRGGGDEVGSGPSDGDEVSGSPAGGNAGTGLRVGKGVTLSQGDAARRDVDLARTRIDWDPTGSVMCTTPRVVFLVTVRAWCMDVRYDTFTDLALDLAVRRTRPDERTLPATVRLALGLRAAGGIAAGLDADTDDPATTAGPGPPDGEPTAPAGARRRPATAVLVAMDRSRITGTSLTTAVTRKGDAGPVIPPAGPDVRPMHSGGLLSPRRRSTAPGSVLRRFPRTPRPPPHPSHPDRREDGGGSADLQDHVGIGYTDSDALVQLSIADSGRMRMADLARAVSRTPSALTRVVGRLEVQGLVTRTRLHRTEVIAIITPSGLDLLAEASPRHLALVDALFWSLLTSSQRSQIGRLSQRLLDSAGSSRC